MADYRKMFDSEYIASWDLDKDQTLTIKDVVAAEIEGNKGEKSKKPIVYFEKTAKGMVLNKTNGKTVAAMYGPNTDDWKGKRITLFASTCEAFGDTVDCIRVRPGVPK